MPLSLVPVPYPSQSLFGGEVLLDALVGRTGTISNIKVLRGDQPFLEKALDAVRTWTFFPARAAGNSVESHIAIVFQFPQPYAPPRSSTVHHYDGGSSVALDRVALPLTTVEPEYPSSNTDEGSVILYESIDREGHLASVKVVRDFEPLTTATMTAAHKWHFAPAKQSGVAIDSAAVIVVTIRRPVVTGHTVQ
jgi:TonB family protein